jgi:Ca-activated chloride channel homolog
MTFLWPELLWLLAAVPVIVAVYLALLRRKKKAALAHASLGMVREAKGTGQRFRRHVPPLLFLLALVGMLVAIARPAAVVMIPSQRETIILAMDVSGSMRATDVRPTRLAAAQAAARAFVAARPAKARIGVVSFAGAASLVQPPTDNRDDILAAIDRFQPQRGTAVGSGILVALKTIFPDVEFDLRSWNPRGEAARDARRGFPLDAPRETGKDDPKLVAPGSYPAAAIILLTDGQTTTGPDPIEAARMAADRGVRVYTVGVGTQAGEVISAEGWSMRVRLDEEALKTIAMLTRGEYFYAGSAEDLARVYKALNTRLSFERKATEITALVTAASALLALLGAALSVLWFNRIL